MKFCLPRQTPLKGIHSLIAREAKKQKLRLLRLTKKQKKEAERIGSEIDSHGLPLHLVCKKLPGVFGKGIFLHPQAQPILKNQVIGFYSGKTSLVVQTFDDGSAYVFDLLSDMKLTRLEQNQLDSNNRYHPRRKYCLQVDALKQGCFTRFINHSDQPNVVAYLIKGDEERPIEVIYLAQKKILPGEQLLVKYEHEESSYWGPMKVKPFPVTPKTFQLSFDLSLIKKGRP